MAASIEPCKDGPYLIRGDFELRDERGEKVELRRATVALCRCGRSQIKPFCDGTHKLTGFRSDGTAETPAKPARTGRFTPG